MKPKLKYATFLRSITCYLDVIFGKAANLNGQQFPAFRRPGKRSKVTFLEERDHHEGVRCGELAIWCGLVGLCKGWEVLAAPSGMEYVTSRLRGLIYLVGLVHIRF